MSYPSASRHSVLQEWINLINVPQKAERCVYTKSLQRDQQTPTQPCYSCSNGGLFIFIWWILVLNCFHYEGKISYFIETFHWLFRGSAVSLFSKDPEILPKQRHFHFLLNANRKGTSQILKRMEFNRMGTITKKASSSMHHRQLSIGKWNNEGPPFRSYGLDSFILGDMVLQLPSIQVI